LTWETVSERDNIGFNLYRIASADNSKTKINSTLIAAQGTLNSGATYQYTDEPASGEFIYELTNVDLQTEEHLNAQAAAEVDQRKIYIPFLSEK